MSESLVSNAINHSWREDENVIVPRLVEAASLDSATLDAINVRARNLVVAVRDQRIGKGGLDAFLHEFELSSSEGVVLMCLAEALLRIPDTETADLLIRDKLSGADWENHLGQSDSLFVNASTWALMLTGRVVEMNDYSSDTLSGTLGRMVGRLGEPVIRQSVTQGMRIMGKQFVMGRTIEEALDRALDEAKQGYTHSFDMLGEAAFTAEDAERYFQSYMSAITAIGANSQHLHDPIKGPGISVKLSAIHPRYEFTHSTRIHEELTPKLLQLAEHAAEHNLGLTIDAEEADRLQLSLEVFETIAQAPLSEGLGRTWPRSAGISKARAARARLACAIESSNKSSLNGSLGQRRLLGYRNQASSGKRSGWVSCLHAQADYGCLLSGLREAHAGRSGSVLPSICHAQCAHGFRDQRNCQTRCGI